MSVVYSVFYILCSVFFLLAPARAREPPPRQLKRPTRASVHALGLPVAWRYTSYVPHSQFTRRQYSISTASSTTIVPFERSPQGRFVRNAGSMIMFLAIRADTFCVLNISFLLLRFMSAKTRNS